MQSCSAVWRNDGQQEPEFLTREIVDVIHDHQIDTFGGLHGLRDAYLDGNKRAGVQASLVFLEGCGIDACRLPEQQDYDLMIRIAVHEAGRSDIVDFFRSEPGGK